MAPSSTRVSRRRGDTGGAGGGRPGPAPPPASGGAAGVGAAACRLGWSEADGLPGLVVDRYGPVSVVQCLTLGMARNAEWVGAALGRLFPGDEVLRLDDPTAARIEGFESARG